MSVGHTGYWRDAVSTALSICIRVADGQWVRCSGDPANPSLWSGGPPQHPGHRPPRAQSRGLVRYVREEVLNQDGVHGCAADGTSTYSGGVCVRGDAERRLP